MSENPSEQETDNSVFGGYKREDLADLSDAKASRGRLGDGRTPRESYCCLDDRVRHTAHSLCPQPFINGNTRRVLRIASAQAGCRFLLSLSVSSSAPRFPSIISSPLGDGGRGRVSLQHPEGPDNGLSKRTPAPSLTLPKGLDV